VLDGDLASAAGPVILGIEMSMIILGLLFVFDLLTLITAIVSVLPFVLTIINWRLHYFHPRRPARLISSPAGIAVVRNKRVRRFTPWRFFDEVRLNTIRPAAPDAPPRAHRFTLVLVNTYKPTISAYLNSRGTNNPSHAFPIEFIFESTPAHAEHVGHAMGTRISNARIVNEQSHSYNASTTDSSLDGLIVLTHCPSCNALLNEHRHQKTCASCAAQFPADSFILPGRSIDRYWPRGVVIVGLLIAALLSLLAAQPVSALVLGATAAVLIVICYWSVLFARRTHELIVVHAHGIEQWRGGTTIERWSWSQLPTFRATALNAGQWRLAFWTDHKTTTSFNHMLFTWFTDPPGGPALDVVLDEDQKAGWRVCHEIESHRRNAGIAPGQPMLAHPALS